MDINLGDGDSVNLGQLRLFSAVGAATAIAAGAAIRVLASSSMAFYMLIFMRFISLVSQSTS
jgi:hypothetical protein